MCLGLSSAFPFAGTGFLGGQKTGKITCVGLSYDFVEKHPIFPNTSLYSPHISPISLYYPEKDIVLSRVS